MNTFGWYTVSTLSAMNGVLQALHITIQHQGPVTDGSWAVVQDGSVLSPYYDGMIIAATQAVHRKRGETVQRAYTRGSQLPAHASSASHAATTALLPGSRKTLRQDAAGMQVLGALKQLPHAQHQQAPYACGRFDRADGALDAKLLLLYHAWIEPLSQGRKPTGHWTATFCRTNIRQCSTSSWPNPTSATTSCLYTGACTRRSILWVTTQTAAGGDRTDGPA